MTLRVTLEIVPFGEEANKRTLHTIDVSNIGTIGYAPYNGQHCEYSVTVDGQCLSETLTHFRDRGAMSLAIDALDLAEMALAHADEVQEAQTV